MSEIKKISLLDRLLGKDTVYDFEKMASDSKKEVNKIKSRKSANLVAFRKARGKRRCTLSSHTGGNNATSGDSK